MKAWRLFNTMVKAVAFGEWLSANGCKEFSTKIMGAIVEVDYITDYALEQKIPAVFREW